MQLSLHADYSCRVLMYLAVQSEGAKASINDIAEAYGISSNHLVKVVHRLGKLGYVATTRGRGGGLQLAKPAEEISMGKVIRETEPSLVLVECFAAESNTCPVNGTCGLKPWLAKAMRAFIDVLDQVTLADVVARPRKFAEALGIKSQGPA